MRILGLDPSLSCTGWAIVDTGKVVESGTIKTKPSYAFIYRIELVALKLREVMEKCHFDHIAIEDVFVNRRNMKTSIQLAKVHGAILRELLNEYNDKYIKVYAPKAVKLAVTRNGNASKEQVLKMVQMIAGYKGKQLDEADAIAVALTCERDIKKGGSTA